MALKEDPQILFARDRISSILSRIEGVELVPYYPGVDPEGAVDIGTIFFSTPSLERHEMPGPLEWLPSVRPFSMILTSSNKGEEFKRGVRRGIKELRGHLVGMNPDDFRPMHLPHPSFVIFARPITLDGFPVRVVQTWDTSLGGYRTTFDAHRPEHQRTHDSN